MSQENLEVVRRAIDAFNRRDIDAVMRDAAPDVEVDWSHSRGIEAGVYVGHEAARRFWTGFFEMFERLTIEIEELIPSGEFVIVPNVGRARGRDGIEVQARSVAVASLRDGMLVRWSMYQHKAEALEAVGLAE